jgi:hypothetical protein
MQSLREFGPLLGVALASAALSLLLAIRIAGALAPPLA